VKGTPINLSTDPSTEVDFSYASSVVCSGTTYNLVSVDNTSPLTSGASGSDISVSAHYASNISVTVNTSPSGRSFAVDSTLYTTSQTGRQSFDSQRHRQHHGGHERRLL